MHPPPTPTHTKLAPITTAPRLHTVCCKTPLGLAYLAANLANLRILAVILVTLDPQAYLLN